MKRNYKSPKLLGRIRNPPCICGHLADLHVCHDPTMPVLRDCLMSWEWVHEEDRCACTGYRP